MQKMAMKLIIQGISFTNLKPELIQLIIDIQKYITVAILTIKSKKMIPRITITSNLISVSATWRGWAEIKFCKTGKNSMKAVSSFLFISDEIFL